MAMTVARQNKRRVQQASRTSGERPKVQTLAAGDVLKFFKSKLDLLYIYIFKKLT
jgi:hypothetical protein